MESENSYTQSIKKLPDDELFMYIKKPDEYQDEAVIAAILELQKRGISDGKLSAAFAMLEEKQKQFKPAQETIIIEPSLPDEIMTPVLYSKSAIRLFSILFSTLFGGILLSINLSRINKRKEILYVISFTLLFSYATGFLATYFPDYITYIALFMNLLGLFILEGFFWKRMIGNELKYINQPIWTALGISILLAIVLLWSMMK
jgi:hypothetical protein